MTAAAILAAAAPVRDLDAYSDKAIAREPARAAQVDMLAMRDGVSLATNISVPASHPAATGHSL